MAKTSPKLARYRDKRHPTQTTEPFSPEPMRSGKGTLAGAFVVHLHAARRRHYDLRIEVDGSLMSFAVPKGPSLNPEDKRLAVNTENHPLEYLDFEDIIPEGNYGAGAMIVWDRGRVHYLEGTAQDGIARGKIDFELRGFKLRGRFGLVKTSGRRGQGGPDNQWLLLKKSDGFSHTEGSVLAAEPHSVVSGLCVEELAHKSEIAAALATKAKEAGATPSALDPVRLTPMLCVLEGARLKAAGWLYELKLDGVRIVATLRDGQVTLRYRTRRVTTSSYPEVARAVASLPVREAVLDGEIIAFDETGRPSFQRLGQRIHAQRPHDVARVQRLVRVVYAVFDLLALEGLDVRELPLWQRKQLLGQLVRGRGLVRTLDHLPEDGTALFEFCKQQRLEGVVAKRANSRYVSSRSGDWVKLKCDRDDDFVIVGWTRGEGARRALGALEVASHCGPELVIRGRVGSGLDERTIDQLLPELEAGQLEVSPASGATADVRLRYTEPRLVVRVTYTGWTDEGRLRHPVFRGVRTDHSPLDCTAAPPEELLHLGAQALASEPPMRGGDGSTGAAAGVDTGSAKRRASFLTNQDKVLWPGEGYTKGDLCTYYATMAEVVLPYIRERPVILVRYPDGIEGKNFYQWNAPKGTPTWVQTFPLRWEEVHGREVTSFLVNDADTLVYIANLGCIPLHVLASRVDTIEHCDFLTLDFDVGRAPFRHAIELARALHELLTELELEGYPKSSGQTGLHVLVPLGPGVPFATAKTLAELLGRILHTRRSDISSIERMRAKRADGTIYIDTGQTGRSRSIVAPYSVRAIPGARVSTPLSWDEVSFALDPSRFTMFTLPERLERYGDPMRGLLSARPDVAAVVARLGELLKAGGRSV